MSNIPAPGGGPLASGTPVGHARSRVIALIERLARTAAMVATDTGIPALSGGLKLLSEILQKVQEMSLTIEEIKTLNERLQYLNSMLATILQPSNNPAIPAQLRTMVDKMVGKWREAGARLDEITAKSRGARFYASKADSKKVAGLIGEINKSLQDFQTGVTMHTAIGVQRIQEITSQTGSGVSQILTQGEAVQSGVDNLLAHGESVQSGINKILTQGEITHTKGDNLLKEVQSVGRKLDDIVPSQQENLLPRYAKKARYDAVGVRRSCLAGTRTQTLDRLLTWVTIACTRRQALLDVDHGNIYWACGFAGSGKTTLAHSVAEKCENERRLGGSFFFSRSDAECKDPELLFTTISRQLCGFDSSYKEKIVAVLQRDPTIQYSGASRQFEELIVRPLEELKTEGKTFTCAIVIDALDECDDSEATSTILTIIAQFLPRVAQFLPRVAQFLVFIITSRPERRIAAIFDEAHRYSLSGATRSLVLHKIELNSVLHDIRLYLKEGFNDIITKYTVNKGWPSDQDLNRLVVLSGGLFIWAATALLFIMDDGFADPQEQLRRLVASTPSSPDQIQSLYDEILKAVVAKDPLKARLRAILGTIATAQESLSLNTLADFTGCSVLAASNALIGLRSVLHIPEDPSEPILIIHPTFPEYLLTPSATKPELFHFGFADEHSASLRRCLNTMNSTEGSKVGLKRDILELKRGSVLKSEIPDLSRRVNNHIPPSLRYACRYWSIHLSHVVGGDQLEAIDEPLRSFLTQHALHWLEVSSYLDSLEGAILALDSVRRTYQKLGTPCVDLCPLLADLYRFAYTYVECISASPLDTYHSALVHAPPDSEVKWVYGPSIRTECSLRVCRGAPSKWSRVIGTLQGSDAAKSVTFSPNGRYLAISSKAKVDVWNLTTRTLFSSVTLHEVDPSGLANCDSATFCPDNIHLAVSASLVGVAIFQVSSGHSVQTLQGGSDGGYGKCSPPVYVANGRRLFIVTGGEAKLWECSSWYCIHSRHVDRRSAALISSQGTTIAYIEESYVRLFDVSSGTYMPDVPLPHEGWEGIGQNYHASFSPDDRHIAIAKSYTVRILDVEDATITRSVKHPGTTWSWINSAPVFSPDGRHLAWSDREDTVGIIRVDGGNEDAGYMSVFPKTGRSIAWSPDGTQLGVCFGMQSKIAIWDSSIALQRQPPRSHHPSTSLLLARAPRFAILYASTAQDDRSFTLLSLPSPIFTNALTSFFAHQDLYTLEPCADMADVMDIMLQHSQLETFGSAEWTYLMGWQQPARNPCATVSPDRGLVAWRNGGGVSLYNLRLAKPLATLTFPSQVALNFIFSPNSALLAITWQALDGYVPTGVVCIYKPEAGSPICSHTAYCYPGCPLSFSPDSGLVAFLSSGDRVVILDWRAERVIREVDFRCNRIDNVALTADGKYLLTRDIISSITITDTVYDTVVYRARNPVSFNFSPDDTGLLVRDWRGEVHTVKLWNPGERVWPVYHATDDGWVHAKSPGRAVRLCWLPPHLREIWTVSKGKFCAADREQTRAVVFDVSRIPAYVENWGSESK